MAYAFDPLQNSLFEKICIQVYHLTDVCRQHGSVITASIEEKQVNHITDFLNLSFVLVSKHADGGVFKFRKLYNFGQKYMQRKSINLT